LEFPLVGVVGAGVMGAGVAQDLAQTGHQVVLVDVSMLPWAGPQEIRMGCAPSTVRKSKEKRDPKR